MVHHPLVLWPKLVVFLVLVVVLAILRGYLSAEQFTVALVIAGGLFVAFCAALWTWAAHAMKNPNSWLARRMILSRKPIGEGENAADDSDLIGRRGVTDSPLRPSGVAIFDGKRLRVVTDGQYIPTRTPVKIVEVGRSRIVVQRIAEAQQPPASPSS